jgi:hypothetical protein
MISVASLLAAAAAAVWYIVGVVAFAAAITIKWKQFTVLDAIYSLVAGLQGPLSLLYLAAAAGTFNKRLW